MKRIRCIDWLKCIAIIGVLLYHMGVCSKGYLGVEVFFVVSGYLFAAECRNSFNHSTFSPVSIILKKIRSFWPMVLATSLVSLLCGFFTMLPDDYENLSESALATILFSNNILQAITTGDYWNTANIFKPLMHFWYLGVLMEMFVLAAILIWAAYRVFKKDVSVWIWTMLTIVSFSLYLCPVFSDTLKFYGFPFRLFELASGALIFYIPAYKAGKAAKLFLGLGGSVLLPALMFCDLSVKEKYLIPLVVLVSLVVIREFTQYRDFEVLPETLYKVLTSPGRYSLYIYCWHQVFIALGFYSFFREISVKMAVFVLLGTGIMSFISILFHNIIKKTGPGIITAACLAGAVVVAAFSIIIYCRAGVVRDIPELGIYSGEVHRNMHSEYVDRPYKWSGDFESYDKIHVLVFGNSYGRDFANILAESQYSPKLEIVYIYGSELLEHMDMIEKADYVFYGSSSWKAPGSLKKVPKEKRYVVGCKKFGDSNGIFYINRNREWYFDQKATVSNSDIKKNNKLAKKYGDHYIDMLTPLLEGNEVRIFTDDNHYISQDCKHLTVYGAQYYSRILDLSFLENSAQ